MSLYEDVPRPFHDAEPHEIDELQTERETRSVLFYVD